MAQTLLEKEVLHYPRLDTILMVEEFIKEHSGGFRRRAMWESLPRKVIYQTFCVIFDYLLESNKIAVDRERKVAWIWNPKLVKKYLSKPELWLK